MGLNVYSESSRGTVAPNNAKASKKRDRTGLSISVPAADPPGYTANAHPRRKQKKKNNRGSRHNAIAMLFTINP